MEKQIPLAYREDAFAIKHAVEKATQSLRNLKNIRSSGDKIEEVVIDILEQRVNDDIQIVSGHILDKFHNISKQFDIIGCNKQFNPIVSEFSSTNKLLFFESVYFIGEVKKSIYDINIINDFCKEVYNFKTKFKRVSTYPFIKSTNRLGVIIASNESGHSIGNPLLFFMIIANDSGLKVKDELDRLNKLSNEYFPNLIMVLNAGIFMNVSFINENEYTLNVYPDHQESDSEWIFVSLSDEYALIYFSIILNEHIRLTNLENYRLLDYVGEDLLKNIDSIVRSNV